jgi:hypothetical protein
MVAPNAKAPIADPAKLHQMAARIAELAVLAESADMALAAELLNRAHETLRQDMRKRGLEPPAELSVSRQEMKAAITPGLLSEAYRKEVIG